MINYEESIVIDRPVDRVFDYVTESENITDWVDNMETVRQDPPGPVGKGTRLHERARTPFGKMDVEWEVVNFSRNSVCVYSNDTFLGRMKVTFAFRDMGDKTELSTHVTGRTTGIFRLIEPFLGWIGRVGRKRYLKNIKTILETADSNSDPDESL